MQMKKGLRGNEPTFLAILFMKEEEVESNIPPIITKLLSRFDDIMPNELPKVLQPKRTIYHQIELLYGAQHTDFR